MTIIITSFFLDIMISKWVNFNSFFYPLFSILSLIFSFLYFNKKDNSFFISAFILGLLYDVVITDTLFLNAFVFSILSLILKQIFRKIKFNYLAILLISLGTIVYYRLMVYLILIILNYLEFNIFKIINSILSSVFLNLIYITIIYVVINYKKIIFKKRKHIY
ncbi:MAG: rod shape-determining protein MreD [Firmicutes bacterium]|nr:rod shape-determining protein MreD [Bacillota bacterium]